MDGGNLRKINVSHQSGQGKSRASTRRLVHTCRDDLLASGRVPPLSLLLLLIQDGREKKLRFGLQVAHERSRRLSDELFARRARLSRASARQVGSVGWHYDGARP
jgi:hypothetical protein